MKDWLQRNAFRVARERRGRASALVGAGVLLLLVVAVVGSGPSGGSDPRPRSAGTADGEPTLGGRDDAARLRRAQRPEASRSKRARVVEVREPGKAVEQGDRSEEPPARILAENAKLRRELDHLKALEAERRRVSRALVLAAATFDGPLQLGPGGLAWPVGGGVVSPFGQRWGRLHAGIDIAAPAGAGIRAAQSGFVVISGPTGGYGNYVCVQHTKRLTTCYAHLSRFLTERGETVRRGDPIGLVGCTGHCFGDHLHFETWISGRPVDPMRFF